MDIKLAIVIPTKDRPVELNRLLESISNQDTKPIQIIVVDGGNLPLGGSLKKFSQLNIDYVRLTPPSLTAQRNVGIKQVKNNATLVAFFDDDVVLEPESLRRMIEFWKGSSVDTVGASFNNISDMYKKPNFLEKIFFVNSNTPGRILPSGFQSKICSL